MTCSWCSQKLRKKAARCPACAELFCLENERACLACHFDVHAAPEQIAAEVTA